MIKILMIVLSLKKRGLCRTLSLLPFLSHMWDQMEEYPLQKRVLLGKSIQEAQSEKVTDEMVHSPFVNKGTSVTEEQRNEVIRNEVISRRTSLSPPGKPLRGGGEGKEKLRSFPLTRRGSSSGSRSKLINASLALYLPLIKPFF